MIDMKDDRSLRKILEDLSIALSEDGNKKEISFRHDKELGAYSTDGDVTINPRHAEILDVEDDISDEQEFALIINTESHELEHAHVTDPEAIKDFADEYEDSRPRMAAFIFNVLEDVYLDKRRTDRDKGLRQTQALFSEILHKNQDKITEFEGAEKYSTAVLQIGKCGGTPVGFDEVDDDEFRDYCAKVRQILDEARDTPLQSERIDLSHDIMDLIEDHIGELDAPELEMPEFMITPEDMSGNGDPLPEPQENDGEEQDNGGGGGMSLHMPSNGSGSNGNQEPPECPECGSDNTEENPQVVDGMTAARCTTPFDTTEDWVESVEFIEENNANGICGFRVSYNQKIPKARIENLGYKVVSIGGGTVEIVEPKERYDDQEQITGFKCNDCQNEWLPNLE